MVTKVPKNATPEEIKMLLRAKKSTKKGLHEFVGKLRRGLDGLNYQKETRDEWH